MSAIPLCVVTCFTCMQQCTGVVEDSVQPEYNEEFSFCLAAPDIVGKVLKLSLVDHDSSGKRVVGFSVLALDSCGLGEGELSVKEVWLVISCHIMSYHIMARCGSTSRRR